MELNKDMQALTFDWLLVVHSEEKNSVLKVQTDRRGTASTSCQVQSKALQPLPFSGSRVITNYNNNKVKPAQPQQRVIPNYNSNQVSPSTGKNVTVGGHGTAGGHVTVEVHPQNTTPTLFQRFPDRGIGYRNCQQKPQEQSLAPNAKDLYAYPWDKSNLKSMEIKRQDFEMLDAYASEVGKRNSVEDLVTALLKETRSDLEKVRAIWIWICHHIEYDLEVLSDKSQHSGDPEHILRTGKGVCAGYAGLFERMCRIAGVQCVQLSGFAKGVNYKIGQTFSGESNHAWNAVHLNGKWHLVDSTWGAGFTNDISNKFTFEYNEFYFLTHPALFAEAHFPDNQNWQLLKLPLSLKQFENNIHRKSTFYGAGLNAANPETVIIETVNGKSTVTIESRSPTLFSFSLDGKERCGLMTLKKNRMKLDIFPQKTGRHLLRIYAKPHSSGTDSYENVLEYILECSSVDVNMRLPRELVNPVGPSWLTKHKGFFQPSHDEHIIHSDDGRLNVTFLVEKHMDILAKLQSDEVHMAEEIQKRYILQVQRNSKIEFRVQVPKAGLFALKIYAESTSAPGHFEHVCNYVISCKNPAVQWPAFPMELHNPVGPCLLTEEKGFLQPSHQEPIIYTTDGCCSVSFKLEKDINVMAILNSDDIVMTKDIERRHILQVQQKNRIEIKIQLPRAGSYVLTIYSESKVYPGNFEYVCNYLISCTNSRVKCPPFPKRLQNPVGPNSLTEKKGLLQPSHREPVIYTMDGCCSVSFTLENDINTLATLYSDELPMTEQTERRHILQVQGENFIEFKVQLPQSGMYVLKIYADSKLDPGHYEFACNYLLCCTNTEVRWPAFPTILQNPVGPNRLMKKSGFFQPSHPGAIIHTLDGRCSVSFSLSKNVSVFARLQSDDIVMDEDIESRHVLQVQKENSIDFKVQVPQAGAYALKIYAESDSEPGNFLFVCNYLISCTNTGVCWPAFPEELNSPVGPNWLMEENGVFQPSHLEPIIYTQDGRCSLGFTLGEDVILLATLHSDDNIMENSKRQHIFPVHKGNRVEFKIQLPQAGIFVLKVCAKNRSYPGNLYSYVCNYLLCCANMQVKWPAFPLVCNTWASNYELVEPLNGVLHANSNVFFKLKADGLAAVSVKGKCLFPLSMSADGYWVGTCSTARCHDLFVQVTDNLNKNYSSILSYHVEDEAGMLALSRDKTKMEA